MTRQVTSMSSVPGVFLSFLLFAAASFAQDTAPAKPECNAENNHRIWPDKHSRHPGAPVEICTQKGTHYAWRQLTADISRLKARAKPENSAAPPTADAENHHTAPASQE